MARKILLADDSVTAQNMGRKILSDAGYEVITVNNGSAALKKIAEHKPDLIVLDVYMPGYTGLEVCQRLKENRETARIPVLLTVGKLEPFRPEEARKVRADAYIVKPFEASELLVALTKLEDKIVPQAESYKPERFAKAIAAVEGFNQSETSERFGDAESGWKERLKFPAATPKPQEPEPEPEVATPKRRGIRDLFRRDAPKKVEARGRFERPQPADLPRDITPQEIAAITAAAAQVSGEEETPGSSLGNESVDALGLALPYAAEVEQSQPATKLVSPAPVLSEEPIAIPEPVATAEPIATEASAAEELPPATFAGASRAQLEPSAEISAAEITLAEVVATEHCEAAPESAAPATEIPAPTIAAVDDDAEILAALQTLSPSNAIAAAASVGAEIMQSAGAAESTATGERETLCGDVARNVLEDASSCVSTAEPVGVVAEAAELATAGTSAGETRWIAEAVPLDPSEATLPLQKEMEKAFAAFAAVEGARERFVSRSVAAATARDVVDPVSPEIIAQAQLASATLLASNDYLPEPPAALTSVPEETAAPPANSPGPESTFEALLPSPAGAIESVASAEACSTAMPSLGWGESSSSTPEQSAAAAVVADDANAIESNWVATPTSQQVASTTPPDDFSAENQDDTDYKLDAANAAAWANWREIRDSIIDSTPKVAAGASTAFRDIQQEKPPVPELGAMAAAASSNGSSSALATDSDTIASIVDSVLAELKPKLMEEIARKLKNDSRK